MLRTHASVKLIACVLAGAVLPFAYAPFGLFWIVPLSYAVLFYAWAEGTAKQAFWLGFAHGCAGFLAGMYWIYISVHVFGEAPMSLALFLMLGLVVVLALFVASTGWIAVRWFPRRGCAAWLGVLPALWVLTEWTRGWFLTGFGWLSAGYSQTDSWLMAYAPLLGLHGMSWAVALSAGALLVLLLERSRLRVSGLITLVLVWGVGYALVAQRWTEPKGELVSVALVQGAVPQDLKWLPQQLPATLTLYRELTRQTTAPDLVVWPEAAIPALYSQVRPYLEQLGAEVTAWGGVLLLGILQSHPESGTFQNTLVAMDGSGSSYTKRHLVPFGEYFPVPGFIRRWMRLMSLPYVDAVPGPPEQPPLALDGESVAVTICYEDVFGAEQLHYFPEASLLVNISNDAWFGDSVAPHQHLQIARLRAAEVGRYQLRVTNTGISAVIDPSGQVIAELPQFEPAVLESTVQGFTGSTPYARWGNAPVVLGALLVLVAQLAMTKLTIRPGT